MLSEPFANALAAGRPQFNARVAEARHRYPELDTTVFSEFLRTAVEPVVVAVHAIDPTRVAPVTIAAYDIALELAGQALVGPGARTGVVDELWRSVLPRYAHIVVDRPQEVLAALTNAALNVAGIEGARVEEWLRGLSALAPRVESLAGLRRVGQILAWRAGGAHYRAGALAAADELADTLALDAVGAQSLGSWAAAKAALSANPWWCEPERRSAIERGVMVGRFTGFGGSFATPPEAKAIADGFLLRSGGRCSHLIVDAFGAVMHTCTEGEFREARALDPIASKPALAGSRLRTGSREIDIGMPARAATLTWNDHTVAVSSPYSFSLRLVPLA